MMPNPSLSRTLKSIQNLVDQEEWYAAHQKYRTSAARLLKSSDPASIQDSISLLFEGSRLLLQRNQIGSGTDLALMLIRDVYVAKKVEYTPDERNKVLNLIALAGSSNNWRKTIIDSVIAWSSDSGECPTGDPVIHLNVGETLFKENQFQQAATHLLSACNRDSAKVLSDLMWAWSKQESEVERNLGKYAGMGVIGFLEIGSITGAKTFLDHFLAKTSTEYPKLLNSSLACQPNSSNIQVFMNQSLNFLQLLIITCQVGSGSMPNGSNPPSNYNGPTIGKAVYQALIGRYSRSEPWLGTPQMKEAFSNFGEMYFGIKQPRQAGNILSDLMGSLFSGGGGGGGGGGNTILPPSSRTSTGGITSPALD